MSLCYTHVCLVFLITVINRSSVEPRLCGDSNNTASWASASVAGLLALLVTTLAEIVSAAVNNDSATKNALWADQLDVLVSDGALAIALAVGLEVAEVTDVTLRVGGCAVSLAVWVEVRASAGASVGVVTKGVNVHATLSVGIIAADVP